MYLKKLIYGPPRFNTVGKVISLDIGFQLPRIAFNITYKH